MAEPEQRQPKSRGRSPSYPGISLDQAVQRARTIYEREGRHSAPISSITHHWGFSAPTNGGATIAVAALKKFGLLADEGTGVGRMGRLTDLALDILLNPDQDAVAIALKEAALTPPIHRELWAHYQGTLPSDNTLQYELVRKRHFTDGGATDFISQFRTTISFAKLDTTDSFGSDERSSEEEHGGGSAGRQPGDVRGEHGKIFKDPGYVPRDPAVTTIPVLLPGSDQVIIEGKFPITEQAWDQLIAVLNAMKPGLVREPDTQDPED